MKVNFDDHNGDKIDFHVGASRKELYAVMAGAIACFSWICTRL